MSRTQRRTNAEHLKWGATKVEDVFEWDLKYAGLISAEVYIAQRHAKFHRDNHRGAYGVPRWFRNRLNRVDRHAARAEIIRHRQVDCWEGHLPPRQVKDAAWLWW